METFNPRTLLAELLDYFKQNRPDISFTADSLAAMLAGQVVAETIHHHMVELEKLIRDRG